MMSARDYDITDWRWSEKGVPGAHAGKPAPGPDKMEDPKKNRAGNSPEVRTALTWSILFKTRSVWTRAGNSFQGLPRDHISAELNLGMRVHVEPIPLEGLPSVGEAGG